MARIPKRQWAAIGAAVLASTAHAQSPITTVEIASIGDPAPDLNGLISQIGGIAINNHNEVAFSCRLFGTEQGSFDNQAVIVMGNGTARVAARFGDAVPGGGFLSGVLNLGGLNDDGSVVCFATRAPTPGVAAGDQLVFRADADGTIVPIETQPIGFPIGSWPQLAADGRAAYSQFSEDFTTTLKLNDGVSQTVFEGTFERNFLFFGFRLHATGAFATQVNVSDTTEPFFGRTLEVLTGPASRVVARDGDPIPGLPGRELGIGGRSVIRNVDQLDINANGDVVYLAQAIDPVLRESYTILQRSLASQPGTSTTLAAVGDVIDGGPAITEIMDIEMGDISLYAFTAQLEGGLGSGTEANPADEIFLAVGGEKFQPVLSSPSPVVRNVIRFDPDIEMNDLGSIVTKILFDTGLESLYMLETNVSCRVDLNGDGVLDIADIDSFVAKFFASDLAADFNGDGVLDTGDIDSFVGAFLNGF